jgi:hypothetical protein
MQISHSVPHLRKHGVLSQWTGSLPAAVRGRTHRWRVDLRYWQQLLGWLHRLPNSKWIQVLGTALHLPVHSANPGPSCKPPDPSFPPNPNPSRFYRSLAVRRHQHQLQQRLHYPADQPDLHLQQPHRHAELPPVLLPLWSQADRLLRTTQFAQPELVRLPADLPIGGAQQPIFG